jgi:ubiquinone/menaquinone biosynthesis C-methylase UbiE
MTSLDSFPWPPPPESSINPRWNGRDFEVGDQTTRILAYGTDPSHWSDDLTSLHEVEAGRNHPIDLASRRLAVSSMARLRVNTPIILDVGCSTGFVLEDLKQKLPSARLISADYLREPLEGLARRMPAIPILQFDLRKCPLPTACVDGITCINVLEHIDNHETALAEIYRILKPGGIAHIEVPAGPSLYDIYDEHLMHHRRYRRSGLVAMARRTGFEILKATHLGFFVFPAFALVKRRNKKLLSLPADEKAKLVVQQIRQTRNSHLFAFVMHIENALGSFISYPYGIRCILVLRKT